MRKKKIIIIEKGWGIKATITLNQKEDHLFVRIILMKQAKEFLKKSKLRFMKPSSEGNINDGRLSP